MIAHTARNRSVGGTCIVYYHGNDWSGVPARQRYLMEALSDRAAIVYLDGGADRRRRIDVSMPSNSVTVVRGLASLLGSLARRGLHLPARVLAARVLRPHTKGYERVIFWNAENVLRPYRYIKHDLLVFDCIDPAFSTDLREVAMHEARNLEVLKTADVVFASAWLLKEHCTCHHPRVHLLNNACAPAEYSPELVSAAPRPEWWPKASPRPIAAYLGTLDWRVDFNAIEAACLAHPEIQFILAGHVLPEFQGRVGALASLPNVICPGRISVEGGRYLLSRCDVGLIPFIPGEMNDAVNPVKLYAYALLGKPVAATDLRELRERPEIATVQSEGECFSDVVGRCMG